MAQPRRLRRSFIGLSKDIIQNDLKGAIEADHQQAGNPYWIWDFESMEIVQDSYFVRRTLPLLASLHSILLKKIQSENGV